MDIEKEAVPNDDCEDKGRIEWLHFDQKAHFSIEQERSILQQEPFTYTRMRNTAQPFGSAECTSDLNEWVLIFNIHHFYCKLKLLSKAKNRENAFGPSDDESFGWCLWVAEEYW